MDSELMSEKGGNRRSSNYRSTQPLRARWIPGASRVSSVVNLGMARRPRWAIRAVTLLAAAPPILVLKKYHNPTTAQRLLNSNLPARNPSNGILRLLEKIIGRLSTPHSSGDTAELPHYVRDPGPLQLLAACIVYSAAMHGFYHLHRADRYQFWVVLTGAASAFIVGWACGESVHETLMDIFPWFLMISMVLSAAFHGVLRAAGYIRLSK
ncbi:hypothetical protein BU26DRAFT_605583 [Trematosphaeria pertusa]|uniref:Uncharacterized protein n=1 Tax=Trematosphaeria pertusa TaxID=390896 RepID=A0A6A6ICA5_9PLEO|nr:uncharacterized protein BU26DRAFT_605583 [Trematosphaeria pertusa]KAF2248046.1 hypothetical protein BU26DRAFT_605583 [Trematosphaeria pertusa]